MVMPPDLTHQIKSTLEEAANDSCVCCQGETLRWLHDLGWQEMEVEGTHAKIRFGYKISDYRLEVFSKPGILSNCRSSKGEVEAL